jgi:cytochrome c553
MNQPVTRGQRLRHRAKLWLGSSLIASIATVAHAQADAEKLKSYGQHLGRECVTCHRIDGVDNGIPGIVGWTADVFVETMGYYKDGRRTNQAMTSVAQSLDDDQVKALAAYFATLAPPSKAAAAKPASAPAKKR